jgi:endonuclease/exonuclease/phosphatase family metal-dependent hydrolase
MQRVNYIDIRILIFGIDKNLSSTKKYIQYKFPSLQAGIGGVGHQFMIVMMLLVVPILFSCSPSIHYQPPVNDPLILNQDEDNQFSILTYNIQSIFGKNQEKLNSLMTYINTQQYDFVIFQELFDESVRDHIITNIDKDIYGSMVSRVDYNSFPEIIFQDAGLFLMSKYPQIDLSGVPFDNQVSVSEGAIHMNLHKEISLSTDFLANKSIMGSLHQIADSTHLFIFTTHAQALGSISHKREQYRQIRDFIEYATYAVVKAGIIKSPQNMIVLLTGDFNSDAYDEDKLETLIKELGYPRDLHEEMNPEKKEYTMMFKLFNMYKRFDYIFAYDELRSVPYKKVIVQSINVTDIKNNQNSSISDHLAIKASLQFIQNKSDKNNFHHKSREAK